MAQSLFIAMDTIKTHIKSVYRKLGISSDREHLGYRDGIGDPAIEGNDPPAYPSQEPAIKAGEFIFGYHDERGLLPPMPQPEALGRNGTYMAFRKLHSHVAEFRKYLKAS